jgi:hypothetical protein
MADFQLTFPLLLSLSLFLERVTQNREHQHLGNVHLALCGGIHDGFFPCLTSASYATNTLTGLPAATLDVLKVWPPKLAFTPN